jgi:hypothetical protein
MGKTLIINPVGGLANRMRAIASGLSLAKDLNIDYKIIWLSNWEIMAKADDIFNLPDELKSKIEYPSSFKYNFLYSAPGKRNLLIPKLTLKRFGFVKLWSEIDEWPDSAPEIIQFIRMALELNISVTCREGLICILIPPPFIDIFFSQQLKFNLL